jgi:anti-sigma regulatory factor (Ser/Thr protein kinase)
VSSHHARGLDHDLLLYDDNATFAKELAAFFGDDPTPWDQHIVIAPRDRFLAFADLVPEVADGVVHIDAAEWYGRPVSALSRCRQLLRRHRDASRVRIVGDVAIGHDDCVEWARCESAINEVFADFPVSILCSYHSDVPRAVVDRARQAHPAVVESGVRFPNVSYREPAVLVPELRLDLPVPTGRPVVDVDLPAALSAVRREIEQAAQRARYGEAAIHDFLVAVTELATNALVHGGGAGRLQVWCDHRALHCEVNDEGPGLRDVLAGYRPPALDSVGGAGLWATRHLVDRLELLANEPHGVRAVARLSA